MVRHGHRDGFLNLHNWLARRACVAYVPQSVGDMKGKTAGSLGSREALLPLAGKPDLRTCDFPPDGPFYSLRLADRRAGCGAC